MKSKQNISNNLKKNINIYKLNTNQNYKYKKINFENKYQYLEIYSSGDSGNYIIIFLFFRYI